MRHVIAATLLAGLAALPSPAQFWIGGDYQSWSKQECERLLANSPWARTRSVSQVLLLPLGPPGDYPVAGREVTPQVFYTVRFLSALPIRQALVRFSDLARGDRDVPLEEDAARQARAERFIQQTYPHHIIVQLLFTTNARAYDQELLTFWQTRGIERLKQEVLLHGGGPMVPPSEIVIVPGGHGEIHLIFPRAVDGRPVVTAAARSLRLEFPHPPIGVLAEERIFLEFRIRDMVVDGKLIL
jgi:hypothetical protein